MYFLSQSLLIYSKNQDDVKIALYAVISLGVCDVATFTVAINMAYT